MNREDETSLKTLKAPEYTDEEQAQLVTDLLVLKKGQIQGFLARNELPRSGTKAEIRDRIEEALREGDLPPERIVQFLDEVTPWGKQHVYLYKGPESSIANWKKTDWVASLLKEHRLGKYLNATLPLALPDAMKISSILHSGRRLRITAIKKREWWERDPEYDESKTTPEGDPISLRAFVHRVTRGLVALEWDLNANAAFLQISQLPAGFRYEEVSKEFLDLISGWLDVSRFPLVDLRPVIKKLQELEGAGTGEIRSHGSKYRSLEGRTLEAKSASPADPLFGEPPIDAVLAVIRECGVGHIGNFYWLVDAAKNPGVNPLETEVHVIIIGWHSRISFPTPNNEKTIRHVLSRIRRHSA